MIRALLSDSDGTLVDTVYLIRRGLYETAKQYAAGLGAADLPSFDEFKLVLARVIGSGARQTLENCLRELYAAEPAFVSRMDFDAAYALLDPIQDELAPGHVQMFNGFAEALREIGAAGVELGIVTSGTDYHMTRNFAAALPELGVAPHDRIDALARALEAAYGIKRVVIVTHDDVPEAKPDPSGVLMAMRRLGVTAGECAMLGDHAVDMEAAQLGGVPLRLGITHGFDDAPTLEAAGATKLIHSLAQLPGVVL